MIDIQYFYKLIEGKFENRIQAFSNPSKYAYIRVTHVRVKNSELIYGEQAYNYQLNKPYRQFVLEPIVDGDCIRIKNYELKYKDKHVAIKNVDQIKKDDLIFKEGCDVVVKQFDTYFKGGLQGCNCMVNWKGRETYLKNEILLTPDKYFVLDMGMCATNHHQIWGSKNGKFEFSRMPL
jgi:CpeT protein